MSEWIDRNSALTPEDGQQTLVQVRCQNSANDFVGVSRYDEGRDLFDVDSYTQKVVRWMPVPKTRRVKVDWERWRAAYEERKGR